MVTCDTELVSQADLAHGKLHLVIMAIILWMTQEYRQLESDVLHV